MGRNNYYQVTQFSDHIYRITSPEGVFMELFTGNHHALLLDTGFGFGNLKAAIQSVTSLPLIVVNTHGHLDHCNGNYQFTDSPVYMNEKDWDMYRNNYLPTQRKSTLEQGRHKKIDWNSDAYANILPKTLDEDYYIYCDCKTPFPLNDGNVFELGGITLKVIEVPGHTPGSCALLHEETKILYIGDAANSHMVLSSNGSMEHYKKTLTKLQKLEFKHMLLSHEPDLKDKSCIDSYLDCVEHCDTDNYMPIASLFDASHKDYMYLRRGYSPSDMNKPGFASFIVSNKLV